MIVDFPECEQFADVPHRYKNCRHERLTPEKCDLWRISNGLEPLDEANQARATPKGRREHPVRMSVSFSGETPKPINRSHVGTELKKIFQSLGVSVSEGCSCSAVSAKMDSLTIEEVESRKEEFVSGIKERAKSVTWDQWVKAAALAVANGLAFAINPLDPIPGLFDEAVRRAKNINR